MPKRDQEKAAECVAQAELMRDPLERMVMLQIAQGYLKLADMAGERYERGTGHRNQGEAHPENDS